MSRVRSGCVNPALRPITVRLFLVSLQRQKLYQFPLVMSFLSPRFVSYHGMIGLVCGYVVAVKQYHPDSVPFPPPTPPTLRVKVSQRLLLPFLFPLFFQLYLLYTPNSLLYLSFSISTFPSPPCSMSH